MLFIYFGILIFTISFILVLTILGAIASSKWKFNFIYISFISVFIYLITSYWATRLITPMAGITMLGLIGLFEATIGLKVISKFKDKMRNEEGDLPYFLKNDSSFQPNIVLLMVLIYSFIGWIGTLFV